MNKKNLIALFATLFILLPGCKSEKYYEGKDLRTIKIYDRINEENRCYIMEIIEDESYSTSKDGSLKSEARTSFRKLLSEDVYDDANVTKSKLHLSSIVGDTCAIIDDIDLENEELDIKANCKEVFIQDDELHINTLVYYWDITKDGETKEYISYDKDENGEFIITDDIIFEEMLEFEDGTYTESDIIEIEENMNKDKNSSYAKKLK